VFSSLLKNNLSFFSLNRYDYKNYIGGVLLITLDDFHKVSAFKENVIFYSEYTFQVNGMSNNFWGWGLEDDEFFLRLKSVSLKTHHYQ
jgi:xylosylprotein 4-beta-galactosyltransferase